MDLLDRWLRPLRTGVVTSTYPTAPPVLEPGVRGLPELDPERCTRESACVSACPTGAIVLSAESWSLDAGRCVFCGACARACPTDAIALGSAVTIAAVRPAGLLHVTPLPARADR